MIYAEVRAGRTLPDGVTVPVPVCMVARRFIGVSDVEVVAVGELAMCEAVDEADPAKKRKKTMVDPDVKDWFLDYHEGVKHKWT